MKMLQEIVAMVVFAFFSAAVAGWVFMLTVGVIHAQWLHTMPTIGFGPAILVSILVSLTINTLNFQYNSDK